MKCQLRDMAIQAKETEIETLLKSKNETVELECKWRDINFKARKWK